MCVVNSLDQLLVGRALAGVAVGAFSMAAPCYLAEVIVTINCGNADFLCAIQVLPAERRGTLGLLPTLLGNTGLLVCLAAGAGLSWDRLALLGAALPLPFTLLALTLPESPVWLLARGRKQVFFNLL